MPSAEHQEEMPDRGLAQLCNPERGKSQLWLAHLCNSLFSYLIIKSTWDRRGRLVGEVMMETINNGVKQPGQQHPHSPWKQIRNSFIWCQCGVVESILGLVGKPSLEKANLHWRKITLNCLSQDNQQILIGLLSWSCFINLPHNWKKIFEMPSPNTAKSGAYCKSPQILFTPADRYYPSSFLTIILCVSDTTNSFFQGSNAQYNTVYGCAIQLWPDPTLRP